MTITLNLLHTSSSLRLSGYQETIIPFTLNVNQTKIAIEITQEYSIYRLTLGWISPFSGVAGSAQNNQLFYLSKRIYQGIHLIEFTPFDDYRLKFLPKYNGVFNVKIYEVQLPQEPELH